MVVTTSLAIRGGTTIQSGVVTTRLAAWLYTGPVGHLAAGVADWVTLLARLVWSRARD
jgi:hypothetical protein